MNQGNVNFPYRWALLLKSDVLVDEQKDGPYRVEVLADDVAPVE